MANPSNDIYILPRDTKETQRLNEQHNYLLRCFPFHVHPAIPVDPGKDFRVADIACGSGIWLTGVAERFPKAECHGFDISGDQFPAQAPLDEAFGPGRVCFQVEDAASEAGPAPEHLGKFDVVAVRLIHISLMGEAWDRAVRNIVAMLKPGGHIQWIDWDPRTAYILQYKPLANHTAMQQLLQAFKDFLTTRDTGAVERLPDLLRERGMGDVLREWYGTDPDMETRDSISSMIFRGIPGIARRALVGQDGNGWSEERIAGLEAQLEEEMAAGEAFLRADMSCLVARKPI